MFPPARQRRRVRSCRRLAGTRGSMAVELVFAVPGFLLLLLLIAGGGNWVSAEGQVGGAARDAARAASIARDSEDAVSAATLAADQDLGNACTGGSLTVQVGYIGGGGTFATADDISVTVGCLINLAVFKAVGLDNTRPFTSESIAPLDPFTERSDT
jgi:Flp pilus assembly protein TadG